MIFPLFKPINELITVFNNRITNQTLLKDFLFLSVNYKLDPSAATSANDNNRIVTVNQNTLVAVYNFLIEYKDSQETLKLYIKELERLILWCNKIPQIDLLELKREHIVDYQQFLQDPNPKELWCGDKVPKILKNGEINPKWRPFYKKLHNLSIKKALKIIDSFFNYLVQTNYLPGNPLAIKRQRNKVNSTSKLIDRYLELDEINFVLEALYNYSYNNSQEPQKQFLSIRAKYIILLLFYTGMRISESAKHNMGDLVQRENNWFLAVIGKGKKYREIPIPDALMDALSNFRSSIGLSYLPEFKESTPLIPNVDLKNHLTTRRIDQILKWAFNLGAEYIKEQYPRKASKLNVASAHWLRHSYVTYLLNSGASLKVAQENAGHSDAGTTMLYRHVNQVDRHEATRNLSLNVVTKKED